MVQYLWLMPLGLMVGVFGTLIGAGGGFILVPAMLLLYPDKSPDVITSISLAVVFFNSLSGSVAYARMKRIDYKSGLMFAAATVPGAILGALTVSYLPRRLFNGIFGVLLLGLSTYLFFNPEGGRKAEGKKGSDSFTRHLIDADGIEYTFSYNPKTGIVLSLFVGYLSSLLGIGGGIIHVPALVHLLNFPVHLATATSHFMLAIMAFAGSVVHFMTGTLQSGIKQVVFLAAGVLIGAQAGAKLSKRVRGKWIIRGLAIALSLVGIRILITAFLG